MGVLLLFGFLLALFFGSSEKVPKSWFFSFYATSLICAFVAAPFVIRNISIKRNRTVNSVTLFVIILAVMHWRQGMYPKLGSYPSMSYVINPKIRVNLNARSPAVEFVKAGISEPCRIVGFGNNLLPGFNSALFLESLSGANPLMNRQYRELTLAMGIKWSWEWRIIVDEENLSRLKPFYDLLGVKYYLSEAGKHGFLPGLRLVNRLDLDVFQSDSAWPRAFFVNAISAYESPGEIAAMARKQPGQPFAAVHSTDLTRHPGLKSLLGKRDDRRAIPASDYHLTSNTTACTVKAPGRGLLVLGETYSPQAFRVTVNGKPAACLRVNHAFKGVEIRGPGEYRVEFSYWPHYFTFSLGVAGIGLVLLGGWIWIERRRQG